MTGPHELNVYQTSRCNAACRMCLRQRSGFERAPDMTTDVLRRTLDLWPWLTSATVAGFGEPLISPTLGDCVALLRDRGLYVGIISNGIALADDGEPERVRDLWANHVSISLNAADGPEWEQAGVGPADHYRGVLRGIERLVSLGQRVMLSFVAGRGYYLRIPAWLDRAADLGVYSVQIVNTLPVAGGIANNDWHEEQVIRTSDRQAIRQIRKYQRTHKHRGMVTVWPVPLDESAPSRCQSPWLSVGVDGAGWLSGCRRVMPPLPEHGSIWTATTGDEVATWPHFRQLRAGLTGDGPLPWTCSQCFGRGVDA